MVQKANGLPVHRCMEAGTFLLTEDQRSQFTARKEQIRLIIWTLWVSPSCTIPGLADPSVSRFCHKQEMSSKKTGRRC